MRQSTICIFLGILTSLTACGKKEEATPSSSPVQEIPASAPLPVASVPEPMLKSGSTAPDFGGVIKVSREVEAVGSTQESAVLSAIQSAVAQVNGLRVASQMQAARASLSINFDNQKSENFNAEKFLQTVISVSQGAVTGFEIISQEEIDKVDEEIISRVRSSDGGFSYSASASAESAASFNSNKNLNLNLNADSLQNSNSSSGSVSSNEKASVDVKSGPSSFASDESYKKMRSYWKVKVRVDVAKYKDPEEKGRPKIVVSFPKTLSREYFVGDGKEDSVEIARAIRSRLSDVLTQTKRFIVLDREFGDDIQAEIDHINSGNVRLEDSARIGQQLATDLILIPIIENFEYKKHVRSLKMSNRELVSYSGGGRITLRLVNAATGEVVLSDSFDHKLASADPSTMPRVIDGKSMAAEMMNSLSKKIGQSIVTEIFPISVVALDGNSVVLSQGGDSLQVGQRWEAVYLGEELKDPQTGLSLGRNETPFGTIRVDRVSTQTSYGTIEDGPNLGGKPFKSGVIELRKILEKLPPKEVATNSSGNTSNSSKNGSTQAPKVTRQKNDSLEPVATPSSSNDEKW